MGNSHFARVKLKQNILVENLQSVFINRLWSQNNKECEHMKKKIKFKRKTRFSNTNLISTKPSSNQALQNALEKPLLKNLKETLSRGLLYMPTVFSN